MRIPPSCRAPLATLLLALVIAAGGCAGARPYEREYLADPIMDFAAEGDEEAKELKWLEAREASTGGAGGAGGGCACK